MHLRILLACLLVASAHLSFSQVVINEICSSNGDVIHDPQYFNFPGWIELFNGGSSSVSLGGYYLSDDAAMPQKWQIPSGTSLGSKQRLLIWCDGKNSGFHTNFELDSEGEEVILSTPSQVEADRIVFPEQFMNVAYGRTTDGGSTIAYLTKPSPGVANVGSTGTERLSNPEFSVKAGRYSSSQSVTMTHSEPDVDIRFTTNGSEPTDASTKFTSAIAVSKTTTIKAKAFKQGFIPSKTEVKTYFINEHGFGLPVISITMNQAYLTDGAIGIYTDGTNGIPGNCQSSPFNWNQDWSRHAVLEFFDKTGNKQFDQSVDIRIGGACSRAFPSKSFAIKARDEYGKNTLDEKLFDSKEWASYGGFMLRNAGNDFWSAMFRDALIQTVVKDQMDIDYLAYQPKAIWLNGQYWGILNLREKIDADYFKTNYGVDKEELDLCEWQIALEGSIADYNSYLSNLEAMDLTGDEAYDYIDSNIDVDEFINYLITEIYNCNTDWPGNNVKFWRKAGGKWRWVLWDLDFGMGLYDGVSYASHPTLDFATEANGPGWPNPPWSTQHLRLLLQNPKFRNKFIGTFSTSLSTTFKPERVIGFINAFQNNIKNEMAFHTARWGQSVINWNNEVQRLRTFASQRNSFMHDYLGTFFGMSDRIKINITVPTGQGKVSLNGISSTENISDAQHFRGLAYDVVAEPLPGFEFSHWSITKQETTNLQIVDGGTTWKYWDSGTEPSTEWETESYDDSGWMQGNAQLGYGDGDEQTTVSYGSDANNKYITTYFRKTFTVADTLGFTSLSGKVLFDDGVVIYLNGDEVYRGNLPEGAITGATLATIASTENVYESFTIEKGLIKPGLNTIAVEVHQNGATSSDISFDLELSTIKIGNAITSTSDMATISDVANSDVSMEAFYTPVQSIQGIVINEFSARESEYLDELEEAEDWIEVYNNGNETIDLAGLFITDNLSDKQKYQIRKSDGNTTIAPGEYRILYADQDLFDGPLHVNFKLSADGEAIGLYQKAGNDLQTLDQVSYEAQFARGTYSRIPNITGPFVLTGIATPEAANVYEAIVGTEESIRSATKLFPNPATGQISVTSEGIIDELIIIDMTGQVVFHSYPSEKEYSLDISDLADGLYFVEVYSGGKRTTKKLVKM